MAHGVRIRNRLRTGEMFSSLFFYIEREIVLLIVEQSKYFVLCTYPVTSHVALICSDTYIYFCFIIFITRQWYMQEVAMLFHVLTILNCRQQKHTINWHPPRPENWIWLGTGHTTVFRKGKVVVWPVPYMFCYKLIHMIFNNHTIWKIHFHISLYISLARSIHLLSYC